jgi:hypothetical protein
MGVFVLPPAVSTPLGIPPVDPGVSARNRPHLREVISQLARAGAVTRLSEGLGWSEEPWRERCRADDRSGATRACRTDPCPLPDADQARFDQDLDQVLDLARRPGTFGRSAMWSRAGTGWCSLVSTVVGGGGDQGAAVPQCWARVGEWTAGRGGRDQPRSHLSRPREGEAARCRSDPVPCSALVLMPA